MDRMYKNFIGFAKDLDNTETRYEIELIRDKNTWDKFLKTEDLDLYEKVEYDNISDALTFYLMWFVSDSCYDIKMWQQLIIDGEIIFEEFIEPSGYVINSIRSQIDRDMKQRLHDLERENEEFKKENDIMNKFIKALGSRYEDMFKDFCKKEE